MVLSACTSQKMSDVITSRFFNNLNWHRQLSKLKTPCTYTAELLSVERGLFLQQNLVHAVEAVVDVVVDSVDDCT